ncbi:MAG TPA: hypothetical protein VGS28_04945 [Candidatus Saccharimonadales bacterium]|nr:hypothetical protein [Candidatus Saccharimonadales bacterium]
MAGYGMGGGVGVATTTAGVAGVATLPNTSGFKLAFVFAVVMMVLGLTVLTFTGAMKVKQHFGNKA